MGLFRRRIRQWCICAVAVLAFALYTSTAIASTPYFSGFLSANFSRDTGSSLYSYSYVYWNGGPGVPWFGYTVGYYANCPASSCGASNSGWGPVPAALVCTGGLGGTSLTCSHP